MSKPNPKYCQDFIHSSQCHCEFFSEPVDSTASRICRECGHGFSKHPVTLIAIQSTHTPVLGPNLEPKVLSARQQVLDVFNKWIVKQEQFPKEVRFGNARVGLIIAKNETLKGFRALELGTQSGGRAKGRVSAWDPLNCRRTQTPCSDSLHKVRSYPGLAVQTMATQITSKSVHGYA